MAFNLFKKKDDNLDENFLRGPPSLEMPAAPTGPNIPEPPKVKEDVGIDVPLPPISKEVEVPKKIEPKKEINIPKKEVPEPKFELPKMEEELPAFDDVGDSIQSEAPTPPAFLAKIGDVKDDLDYDLGDSNLKELKKPIFVEVNDYKKLRRTISSVSRDAKKSQDIAAVLTELKTAKDEKLSGWDKQLEKIQRSLIFADKMLFEEGGPNV